MKKTLSAILVGTIVLLGFSGCSQKTWQNDPIVTDTIDKSIINLSDKLFNTSKIKPGQKVAITSFVDLHQLNKTTHFGRKLAESFYAELHYRGFSIVDARGTKTMRINADGEFFITRDIKLLKNKRFENSYILVGTYTRFGDGVMINARIIDNTSGEVVSAARTIIDISDCDLYENCDSSTKEPTVHKTTATIAPKRMIGITDAGCSYVDCPKNCVDIDCYKYNNKKQIKPLYKAQKKYKKQKRSCKNCKIGAK